MSKEEDDPCHEVTLTVDFNERPQFIGRSVEGGQPVTPPLDNLDHLLAWRPHDPSDRGQSFSVAAVPYVPKSSPKDSPKVLVCHDMKGGYLEDRFVQGVTGSDASGYHVTAWSAIDIFVYFSHHFVTAPPVGWVNAGHRNGAAVLGTFIMEGDAGYKRCDKILSSKESWESVAQQLVKLATFYGFDGWLLNIENRVDVAKIPSLVSFIRFFTTKMHQALPHSYVIWYDSVTVRGTLAWQNELNKANQLFYDACDGIFLNYGWTEHNLKTSKVNASSPDSVYVGIDVFGRGCYGGGGFNCAAALSVIKRVGLSAALFAPGWVYEQLGAKNFDKNNARFWKALQPMTSPRPFNDVTGFSTRFNPGFSVGGDWYHLSAQGLMPALPCDYFVPEAGNLGRECLMRVNPVTEARPRYRSFDLVGEAAQPFRALLLMFKLDLKAPEGKVYIRVEADPLCVLVMKTDRGLQEVFPLKDWFSRTPGFASTQVGGHVCISSSSPFRIEGLYVETFSGQGPRYVRSICLSIASPPSVDEVIVTSPPLRCEEVEWEEDKETKKFFIFSCTLVFSDVIEGTSSTEIYYRFDGGIPTSTDMETVAAPQVALLGRAYTSRYRVHNLRVPNPMFLGPNCSILFVSRHLSHSGEVLAEGRLRASYAENI